MDNEELSYGHGYPEDLPPTHLPRNSIIEHPLCNSYKNMFGEQVADLTRDFGFKQSASMLEIRGAPNRISFDAHAGSEFHNLTLYNDGIVAFTSTLAGDAKGQLRQTVRLWPDGLILASVDVWDARHGITGRAKEVELEPDRAREEIARIRRCETAFRARFGAALA